MRQIWKLRLLIDSDLFSVWQDFYLFSPSLKTVICIAVGVYSDVQDLNLSVHSKVIRSSHISR